MTSPYQINKGLEDLLITTKPTYEELEQRVKESANEAFERKQAEETPYHREESSSLRQPTLI